MAGKQIVGIWEMQHWLKFDGGNEWIQVTEDKSIEIESDDNTYEPTYLDRKEQPVFNMGSKMGMNFEIDALAPGGIQQVLAKYEDESNVPCEYMRTLGYDLEKGQPAPKEALVAKTCTAKLNMNQHKGDGGEPITLSGKVSFDSAFTKGTFNPSTKEFTAAKSV